jgi:metal-responsive CopG/Arc/MetJ family transcriptional regulator
MTRVLSFSTDNQFADELERLMNENGYKNRSMFLRDASVFFAESLQRGDLQTMNNEEIVEGTLIIYYQHGIEHKLLNIRHSHAIEVFSYHHNCLSESHTCVDTLQAKGTAQALRLVLDQLKNTSNIDRVQFVTAPKRSQGCC